MKTWWRSHSLRMRLTLGHVAAMVIVLGVYMTVIYVVVSNGASQALNQQIRSEYLQAASIVDRDDNGEYFIMSGEESVSLTDDEFPWVRVWSEDGSRLLTENTESQRRPLPEAQALARHPSDDRFVSVPATPVPIRILTARQRIYGEPVVIQVGRSEAVMRRNLHDLLVVLIGGVPLAVLVAGFGAYMLARRALAPVERMTERAQSITAERLGERLPVHNPDDEMGRLASVFNETLARLEQSFEQMRRFTADVSHELRTPLTAIRSVGEVGLRGHRDEGAYRSIVGSMLEEADRLAGLVDRLLTLSRAETHQAKLSKDVIDLQRLVDESAAHLQVLAEEKGQTIEMVRDATPMAIADRHVLRQAIINLVDNAIKYTPSGGRIRIRLSETERDAVIDVTDSGPGIPAEATSRIFDRFYRVDEGGTGGSGLGLSIAKGAVEANGGQLSLETTSAHGSTFRIAVPRQSQPRAHARRRAG
jgi:heavy metal sensor kinase